MTTQSLQLCSQRGTIGSIICPRGVVCWKLFNQNAKVGADLLFSIVVVTPSATQFYNLLEEIP